MDITKEKTGDLSVVVTIKVGPSDYGPKVDAAVNDYRRRMTMPGFRPGKVPQGLIRKMYGKSILAEEMETLLSEALRNYLETNRIDILGQPVPKENGQPMDLGRQEEYEFHFELGLRPEVNVMLSRDEKFTRYKIAIDDDMITQEIGDLRSRYNKLSRPEGAEGTGGEEASDQAFYDRMFGPGKVQNEEDLKASVRERLKRETDRSSETQLENDIMDHFVRKARLNLPDDFLKRWIRRNREEPIEDDVLEREYGQYADRLRWQLIENKLIKDHNVVVSRGEALEYAGNIIAVRLLMYGQKISAEEISRMAEELLGNEEEAAEIYDRLYDEKLFRHIKESVKITDEEISRDEFLKRVEKSKEKRTKKDKGFFNFGLKRKK